ncbi:transglycosylase SLT domain-containing protein [Streptomyces sp. GKU 257-1]|nr:transglycosylase SLT domain-containing protein [Streptomyces sp. GKU 257-1]
MRTALTALSTVRPTRRLAVGGLTALGAAGIAATALTGTAHAATPDTPDTRRRRRPPGRRHRPAPDHPGRPRQAECGQGRQGQRQGQRQERPKAEYADNLDGWIREARAVMAKHDIPGSYDGIKRNIIRESAGDPNAVNDWDINAQKGIPSKGLLQVIQPTFDQYHVKGTPDDLTDPVANIVAACNYAADRYGSMDNVDSAY